MEKLIEHQLEKIDGGMRCTVCQHTWKRAPVHSCPGVPWYEWEAAPDGLLTKTQAQGRGLRLKKDARPSGCIWMSKRNKWIWLYALDQTEERPAPTEKQVAAAERARARQRELRTCSKCSREVYSRRDLEAGVCGVCWHIDFLETERSAAVRWAQELLAKSDWVILDTETTGLDGNAEIIQIAVLDPATGGEYQWYVRPQGRIEPEAMAVHGITAEMVSSAPLWPKVAEEVSNLLAHKVMVGYNADFDHRMLVQTSVRYGISVSVRWVDVMEQYARWYGDWSEYHASFTWQRLPGGDHSALGDCRATLAVIRKMAESSEG